MQVNRYEDLIGMLTLHPIMDGRGVLLIPEDTIIGPQHIEKLENFKIDPYDIHVQPAAAAAPETAPAAAALGGPADERELVRKTESRLYDLEKLALSDGKVPVSDLESQVLPLIMEAARKRNLFQLFADLKSASDYRYKQTIGVVFMSAALGKWLRLDDKELSLLTTAASLYDIGSAKLPSYLLNKPGAFHPSEWEIMKEHTVLGHEILKESGVDSRVALVALQHHEREDGSGYPHRLKSEDIDPLSKIVALADVYVAMTSERPYRPAYTFYEVVKEIHESIIRGRFDSRIGMTFLNGLMNAQIGSEVLLSDGRSGKILLINPNYPASPLISVGDEFLDLCKSDAVRIQEIVG
ncbi:HD-GYP domain-containing protein [Cohnella caldifontis]|uniref:HD-GYP domain-containing protein n=1 Tax=Cohnella caldifontis TaxID=3027471 RepID=UPI0023EB0B78|nr:HD-GYP domain-containing protein [Cohnella sp. YIM B05605]